MKSKAWLGLFGICSVMGSLAIISACGEEETIAPPGNDGGGGTLDDGSSNASSDSSTGDGGVDPDAGEPITDGGSNIDLDASDDDDGGDASCNTLANDGPQINSACISTLPPLPGGALVAGKYHLANVIALGNPAFCQNQFVPVPFKETMSLTVDGTGIGSANLVLKIGPQAERTRTVTLDPPANNASPLVATQLCPPRGAGVGGNVRYFSGLRNNEQVLIMALQYGNGAALYRFVKQ